MNGVDAAYVYTRGGDGKDTAFRARMYAQQVAFTKTLPRVLPRRCLRRNC